MAGGRPPLRAGSAQDGGRRALAQRPLTGLSYPRPIGPAALDETIRDLLATPRTWAVVGCSPSPHRDSHRIARLLLERGNRVIPINPNAQEILGQSCHASVRDLAPNAAVDVVDIFRRSEAAGEHVDEAIDIGARAVWLQLGVIDEAAAGRARDAGLAVVMDRCPAIEVRRLGIA